MFIILLDPQQLSGQVLSMFTNKETNAQLGLKQDLVILSPVFILLCYATFLQVFVNTVIARICQIWCKGQPMV